MKSPIKVLPYFVLKWPCQLTGRLNPRTHRLLPHSRKTTWNWIANSFLEKENLIQFLFSVRDKTGFCNCTSRRSQLYLGDHQYYAPHPHPLILRHHHYHTLSHLPKPALHIEDLFFSESSSAFEEHTGGPLGENETIPTGQGYVRVYLSATVVDEGQK